MTPAQRDLMTSISSGPRGRFKMAGPFYCYLHAPAFGELAQKLGAHLRFGTSIAPRLSEFAILATARHWKSQYEWAAHVGIAEQKGVKPETVRDLRAGRLPTKAPKDERALYAFVKRMVHDSLSIGEADAEAVFAAGWTEEALYDAITVVALFQFYNAWIDATGVSDMPAIGYEMSGQRLATQGYVMGKPPSV